MKYTKATECDFCGHIQVTTSKKTFKSWFKSIGWFQSINGNGTTNEFCSKECLENNKEDVKQQLSL